MAQGFIVFQLKHLVHDFSSLVKRPFAVTHIFTIHRLQWRGQSGESHPLRLGSIASCFWDKVQSHYTHSLAWLVRPLLNSYGVTFEVAWSFGCVSCSPILASMVPLLSLWLCGPLKCNSMQCGNMFSVSALCMRLTPVSLSDKTWDLTLYIYGFFGPGLLWFRLICWCAVVV